MINMFLTFKGNEQMIEKLLKTRTRKKIRIPQVVQSATEYQWHIKQAMRAMIIVFTMSRFR